MWLTCGSLVVILWLSCLVCGCRVLLCVCLVVVVCLSCGCRVLFVVVASCCVVILSCGSLVVVLWLSLVLSSYPIWNQAAEEGRASY